MAKLLKSNQQGSCPLCDKAALDFGMIGVDDGGVYYPWKCIECEASGKEFYHIEFSSHGQVRTKKGKEILNEDGY